MKILLVEDDLLLAESMMAQLKDLGFTDLQAVDTGEKAIATIKTERIDLVFMDIELAGILNGIQTTEIINTTNKDLPIVYLSKLNSPDVFQSIKETKHVYYLPKPFNLAQLKSILDYIQPIEKKKDEIPVLEGFLFLKKKDQFNRVAFTDILWIEGGRNSITIQTIHSGKYVLTGTFGPFCKKINHAYLVRVHNSYLVNLQHVDSVRGRRFVIGKQIIPFSKTFVPDLEKLLLLVKSSK